MRHVFHHVNTALSLDNELKTKLQHVNTPTDATGTTASDTPVTAATPISCSEIDSNGNPAAAVAQAATVARLSSSSNPNAESAEDMQLLAEHLRDTVEVMYHEWRQAVNDHREAQSDMFKMKDVLRQLKEDYALSQEACAALHTEATSTQEQLNQAQVHCCYNMFRHGGRGDKW